MRFLCPSIYLFLSFCLSKNFNLVTLFVNFDLYNLQDSFGQTFVDDIKFGLFVPSTLIL